MKGKALPRSPRTLALVVWLAVLAFCAAVILRTEFVADLSAFLPKNPDATQKVLVEQLREGVVARLLLVGIEGGTAAQRHAASRELGQRLRATGQFAAVHNGDGDSLARDRAFFFEHRYLLSDAVSAERFTAEGLRAAIGDTLGWLSGDAGLLVKALIPRDPTGETLQLIERLQQQGGPRMAGGVWVSADDARAVLLTQTRASGEDTDGQARAIASLHAGFAAIDGSGALRMVVSGPSVFAVHARDTIKNEVARIATLSSLAVAALLLLVYRSLRLLALGQLPIITGAMVGVTAVSLGFGHVHGLTLGFGVTLIGEAVDYAIYLFVQGQQATRSHFWRTVRLGVATSICGFGAMLVSGFPGLAQLGLYSISGLVGATLVTRYLLPQLMPAAHQVRDIAQLGGRVAVAARWLRQQRWLFAAALLAALAVLAVRHDTLWNREISALSPIRQADKDVDARLRADLGAPDARYMLSLQGPSEEAVLQASEALAPVLDQLATRGVIAGYETPARFLPSQAAQRARQQALPEPATLRTRLGQALAGQPLSASKLEGFLADVERARTGPLLSREDLAGTSSALVLDSLLTRKQAGWSALIPLRAPATGPSAHQIDAAAVQAALQTLSVPVSFIDLAEQTSGLYTDYLREAIQTAAWGSFAVLLVIALALRSARRVLQVCLPLAGAVLGTIALLVAGGGQLTMLHLIGLLLVVAIGSNYALFFDQASQEARTDAYHRTLLSLLLASLTTMLAFGLLASSSVPVLSAMGATVAPGSLLALLFSAMLAPLPDDRPQAP